MIVWVIGGINVLYLQPIPHTGVSQIQSISSNVMLLENPLRKTFNTDIYPESDDTFEVCIVKL